MKLYTYDPRKNKRVLAGKFNTDTREFKKEVKACHFMKKEQGYGIQEDVVQKLQELDCVAVIIKSNLITWFIPFSYWKNAPTKDYGNGLQRFISVRMIEKEIIKASDEQSTLTL